MSHPPHVAHLLPFRAVRQPALAGQHQDWLAAGGAASGGSFSTHVGWRAAGGEQHSTLKVYAMQVGWEATATDPSDPATRVGTFQQYQGWAAAGGADVKGSLPAYVPWLAAGGEQLAPFKAFAELYSPELSAKVVDAVTAWVKAEVRRNNDGGKAAWEANFIGIIGDVIALTDLYQAVLGHGGKVVEEGDGHYRSHRSSTYNSSSSQGIPDKHLADKGWLDKRSPLPDWFNVTTDPGTGRVVRLELREVDLRGLLPARLAYLTELEFLDLRGNPTVRCATPDHPVDSLGLMTCESTAITPPVPSHSVRHP